LIRPSSIIWPIATAPALGAVVTPGVAGVGAGDLTVLTLGGDGVGAEGVTIPAGFTVRDVAEGVTILAGLTARGGVGMLGGRSGVGAGGCGLVFTTTAGVGRVEAVVAPPAPIPGAAPESSTPSIASLNFVPKRQARSPFGLMGWTGAGFVGVGATTASARVAVVGRAG
jgi:hypothetical protein